MTENEVLIFASVDEELIEAIQKLASEKGKHLVRLDNKVLTDYISSLEEQKEEKAEESVTQFIENEENKRIATNRAIELWNYVTKMKPLTKAKNFKFTKNDVVKFTTLKPKEVAELLDMLSLFGLIEFINESRYVFKFNFDENAQRTSARADVIMSLGHLKVNCERYVAMFPQMERENAAKELNEIIRESIGEE